MTLVEVILVSGILLVIAVPALMLLVGSRQEVAATWSETVARNLAMEALEWGATLPTDGLSGPLVIDETPLGQVKQARLADGSSMLVPSFVYDTYQYPADCRRFLRRLEVTDASPSPEVPMLKLTATIAWTEPSQDRVRTLQMWRMIGP
jgi:hypothetical protein